MKCHDIEHTVDCFIDCELAEPERMEFEAHLSECQPCRRLVQEQASWKSLLRAAGPRAQAPTALRGRISEALNAADRRRDADERLWGFWPRGAGVGPRRYAPALVLVLSLLSFLSPSLLNLRDSPVVQESIVTHQRNLPLEITGNPEAVRSWFDGKVSFAVRTPRLEPRVALRGGRLVSLGDREAAHLRYELGGRPISVFIFDPRDMDLSGPRREIIGRHEVFLIGQRGYHVAVYLDHGVGYAVTGALDEPELIRLISPAVTP